MKKVLTLTLLVFIFSIGFSQNGKILNRKVIDISKTPIWNKISLKNNLKPEFEHLENLDFYFMKYKSDSLKVNGFIIEPKKTGTYPVIIFNRGGNRNYGRMTVGTMILRLSKLASEGYIVIGSDYRKEDEFGGAELNDVLNLIESAKEIKKADSKNIGMYGWSRGGMMTYLSLKKSNKIKTAIIGNGVTDQFMHIKNRPIMETKVISECVPNYWQNKEKELKKRSVMFWYDELNKKSSLLILCGSKDQRVSPENSRNIATKLKSINYDFKFKEFDTDHSFRSKRKQLDEIIIDWFNQKLKSNS